MLQTNTDPNTYTVLPQESQPAFDRLLAGLTAEHQPATPTERFLVLEMARAQWKLARTANFENCLLHNENAEHVGQMAIRFDTSFYLGGASPALNRCETTARRSFYQALKQLQALRRARSERPAARPAPRPQAAETTNYGSKPIPPQFQRELAKHLRRDPLFDIDLDRSQLSREFQRYLDRNGGLPNKASYDPPASPELC
jgi:hypothetical protein